MMQRSEVQNANEVFVAHFFVFQKYKYVSWRCPQKQSGRATAKGISLCKTPFKRLVMCKALLAARSDWTASTFRCARLIEDLWSLPVSCLQWSYLVAFSWKEVRCHPFTKKGQKQLQKMKTLTSLADIVVPLQMIEAQKSDFTSKRSDLLTAPTFLIVTSTKCETVPSMHRVAHLKNIIGLPSYRHAFRLLRLFDWISVRLKGPQNSNT